MAKAKSASRARTSRSGKTTTRRSPTKRVTRVKPKITKPRRRSK